MNLPNKALFVLCMAFAAGSAYSNTCGIGTTFQRGSDGVNRCVGAVPISDIKPPQQQSQAQTVGVSTSSSVGVSSALSSSVSNGVSANLNSPIVQEANQSSMYVLPSPASAAALPAGFCTDGRSSQLSILGVGYGSSRSSFDSDNYKRCIEVAKAMRQQSPAELAMAYCESAPDVPVCVSQLIAAMSPSVAASTPQLNFIAEPVLAGDPIEMVSAPKECNFVAPKKKRVKRLSQTSSVCK
jgi:hypothetical protein